MLDLSAKFASQYILQYNPEFMSQVREIWLSSEDTGAYGRDIGSSLPQLLDVLTTAMRESHSGGPEAMLRVGMTNPPYILEHLPAVARALNQKNVFSYLHVPVQSGSDACVSNSVYFTCTVLLLASNYTSR